MKKELIPALRLTVVCMVVFVVMYSALVWGFAQFIAPNHGKGEVVLQGDKLVGFANVGQAFTQDNYFWTRPSAVNYNAAGSGGSNKGASNPDYLQTVQARIDTFLVHNPAIQKSEIPTELVTASGSGLDPHLTPAGALVQVKRIAHVRKLNEEQLKKLIEDNTEKPLFGFLGIEKINVLKLNLALDKL